MGRRRREPQDLDRHQREGHAHPQFRNPDRAPPVGHDPVVARGGEDAAAGDGVAVDGCHHRERKGKQPAERIDEDRHEAIDIGRTAIEQAVQVHPGAKDGSRPGQHDRPDPLLPRGRVECLAERVAQVRVQGMRLSVVEPQPDDSCPLAVVHHSAASRDGGGLRKCRGWQWSGSVLHLTKARVRAPKARRR